MTFTLKKIISAFLMPLGFGVLLGLIGVFFLYKNSIKKAKIFLTLSFIIICVSSYNPIANTLLSKLESYHPKINTINPSVKYAILLGGDFEQRAYGVLEIYNQNKNITIITSGYKGDEDKEEAFINKEKLINLGIPKENILTQHTPKDTKEEALQLKEKINNKAFYLVTSAYHMPRAYAIFKKQGLHPIAYPSGYLEKNKKYIYFIDGKSNHKTEIAFHEMLGLLWSYIKGDI